MQITKQRKELLLSIVLLIAARGYLYAQEKPVAKTPAAAVASVKADETAQDLLIDMALIEREIERIEGATGKVDIPVSLTWLRRRHAHKLNKLDAWKEAKGIGQKWRFDPQQQIWIAPEPPEEPKPQVPTPAKKDGS